MNDPQLPPNCPESEKSLLACCLDDSNLVGELNPNWFYDNKNRIVCEVMREMFTSGQPINLETVGIHFGGKSNSNSVGTSYIAEIYSMATSSANFSYWRDTLNEKLALRNILKTATNGIEKAYAAGNAKDPTFIRSVIEDFEKEAMEIKLGDGKSECADIRSLTAKALDNMEEAFNHKGELRGIPTGFVDIDNITNGLRPGNVFVIAARPGIGKTSLAMCIAEHACVIRNYPVGIFSFEMSPDELVNRMICCLGRVDSTRTAKGDFLNEDLAHIATAKAKLDVAPLWIDDSGGMTIMQLASRVRQMTQRRKLRLVIIDYLGLVQSGIKGASRYEEATLVSNRVKQIAKQCSIPIILIAQLNRDCENEDRAPAMSDLRDSGAIEQDADLIGLMSIKNREDDGVNMTVLLNIVKNRHGKTGMVDLHFQLCFTRFESAERNS